ncbi:MAG: sugar 3,4-ketoisomerase [Muribaculaceae bacterium]
METNKVKIVNLPKICDPRGNLSVVENMKDIPFEVHRVYWTYDVPSGEERGGHSHKQCRTMLIAVSGSFDVLLDDGTDQCTITLNRPYIGLIIEPGIWRVLNNFASGSVCLSLASDLFDEGDYIRDYEEFLASKGIKTKSQE